jgi:hypothetical protein
VHLLCGIQLAWAFFQGTSFFNLFEFLGSGSAEFVKNGSRHSWL